MSRNGSATGFKRQPWQIRCSCAAAPLPSLPAAMAQP
jgi:hypothetical protein